MLQCNCGCDLHTHTKNMRFKSLPTIMLNDVITHLCFSCDESFTEIPKFQNLCDKITAMLSTKEVPNKYEYRFILKEIFPANYEFPNPFPPEPPIEYNMMYIAGEWIFITNT